MSEDEADDQRWFDLMAGRSAGDAQPGTRIEAAWLRAAMLAYPPRPPAGRVPDPAQRVQSLIARARSAGVLPAHEPASGWGSRVWRWVRQAPFAGGVGMGLGLASVLAVVVWHLGMQDGPPAPESEPDVLRGAALQQLQAADPAQRQQKLIAALRAAGLDALPYEALGRLGVDVALPVPLPAAQAAALAAQGLALPAGPSLRVEIVAQPAAPARP